MECSVDASRWQQERSPVKSLFPPLTMDAQEFVDSFRETRALIRLAHFAGKRCDGRGWALILSDDDGIAIMIEDCGAPETTFVKAGAVVNFTCPGRKQPRIVGDPAYFTPVSIGDKKFGG